MASKMRLRAGALDWRLIDDEVVVFDGERWSYLATNRTGTLLWLALDNGATRDELVDRLVAEYGLERRRAADDTERFLDALRTQRLLEEV